MSKKWHDNRKKWAQISEGLVKDDYTNHFLLHFGINDYNIHKESFASIDHHKDVYQQQH